MSSLHDFLNNRFTDEEITNYESYLVGMIKSFIEKYKLQNDAVISETVFNIMFRDVLIDLARLSDYHIQVGHNLSMERISSYFASFIIKRKPLIIQGDKCEDYPFINEMLAKYILFAPVLESVVILPENEESVKKFFANFDHHIKFRNVNPQTFELMMRAFETGAFDVFENL